MNLRWTKLGLGVLLAWAAAPGWTQGSANPVQAVDAAFIQANVDKQTPDWPHVGLDHAETRFSRLDQLNTGNVKDLSLAWSYDLQSTRGVEATPLVVDGVMYVSASWSVVHAIDARTGQKIWTFDPGIDKQAWGHKGCCDVVNRGVALWKGKVYVAAFDGRLIALDAATGQPVWEKNTIEGQKGSYTVTGAPRIAGGKVVIGNGGAEYGVRGYVTAYDAETGAQQWRWFVVPGDPSQPFENEAMAEAAKTWDAAGKWWEVGGGGTVWDSIVYDPELHTLYIGTGNGSPWARDKRSPAGGDNLYLSSIVALDPDTGAYKWHYQETPGDNWDYTATQPMILADLRIDGKPRKVILHAPKNGFFFVIDRTNGEFISARNFVDVNWATGYDDKGRPMELAAARDGNTPYDAIPGPYGAHNWHPMSFNPQTGLTYLPAQHIPLGMLDDKDWKPNESALGRPMSGRNWNLGKQLVGAESKPFGRLLAWDPVAQKEVWRVEHVSPWNGGTLTTAGNLVFQGTADGRLVAYDARSGERLWENPTGTGVVAAPSTYMLDGQQYVSVAVGWGGVYGLMHRATEREGPGKVLTFAVGGKAELPESIAYQRNRLLQGVDYDPALAELGGGVYVANCLFCHGVPAVDRGGAIPNLGYTDAAIISNLDQYVFSGAAAARGMPDFSGQLTDQDVAALKAFIQGTADAVRGSSK